MRLFRNVSGNKVSKVDTVFLFFGITPWSMKALTSVSTFTQKGQIKKKEIRFALTSLTLQIVRLSDRFSFLLKKNQSGHYPCPADEDKEANEQRNAILAGRQS